jgi:2'-5' RNA ligase
VIWAGLQGDLDALRRLAAAVDAEAEALGFPRERREFTPHLTLGRVRARLRPDDQRQLLGFLKEANVQELGHFQPDTLNLMASELRPGGAVYECLYSVPLANKETNSGSD